jgi:hypothetical protein
MESAITQIRTGDLGDASASCRERAVARPRGGELFPRSRFCANTEPERSKMWAHPSELARKILRSNVRRMTVGIGASSARPSPCPPERCHSKPRCGAVGGTASEHKDDAPFVHRPQRPCPVTPSRGGSDQGSRPPPQTPRSFEVARPSRRTRNEAAAHGREDDRTHAPSNKPLQLAAAVTDICEGHRAHRDVVSCRAATAERQGRWTESDDLAERRRTHAMMSSDWFLSCSITTMPSLGKMRRAISFCRQWRHR